MNPARAAPTGEHEPPAPPARVHGWKEIAAAVEVSPATANRLARRNRDPLPVEVGHRGPWAYVGALASWARRQNVPFLSHLELAKARRRGGNNGPAPAGGDGGRAA